MPEPINKVATNSEPGWSKRQVYSFLTALRFLTIVPIPWGMTHDAELFSRSVRYFPLIGLVIGLGGMGLTSLLSSIVPVAVAAFIAVCYLAVISGFLHLDGLADSGDGLLSHRPCEAILAIMKDSRSGAMGVVVLVLVVLGKFAALSSMSMPMLATAVLLMPLAGRTAIVLTMATLPYARPEGGLGSLFYSAKARQAALIGIVLFVATGLIIGWKIGLIIGLALLIVVGWFGGWCRARIGGATGDTLGGVCELTELAVALVLTTSWAS